MSRRINRDDADKLYDYDLHIPSRTLYMGSVTVDENGDSGVDAIMAERVIKGLHLLDQTEGEINIIMNNPGGDWYHGMAIYDAIKACQNPVTIKAYGYVMSMGAVIMQAADERIMSPNARFMIHYGTMGMESTHTKIFQKWADEVKKVDVQMEDVFLEKIRLKHPTFKREELEKMLNYDTILTAQETLTLGLVDKVE